MAKIRTRIISFRMSEPEFEAVEEASRRQGFESISRFARAATLHSQATEPKQSAFDDEVSRLWRRIEALTTALEKLVAHAGSIVSYSAMNGPSAHS